MKYQNIPDDTTKPLLFNCWNKNVLLSFSTDDGSGWFVVLGKHSLHFPVFGASWDNVMLINMQTREGFGRIADQIAGLRLEQSEGGLKADLDETLSPLASPKPDLHESSVTSHDVSSPPGGLRVRLSMDLKALSAGRERVLLKRLFPVESRYVPGALFCNQVLSSSGVSNSGCLEISGRRLTILSETVRGHLESGRSSLLSHRPWSLLYWYAGFLSEAPAPFCFAYDWGLIPWKAGAVEYRLASQFKKHVHKFVTVTRDVSGAAVHAGPARKAPLAQQMRFRQRLFVMHCKLGEFPFSRAAVYFKDSQGDSWWGIEETFQHPELDTAPLPQNVLQSPNPCVAR